MAAITAAGGAEAAVMTSIVRSRRPRNAGSAFASMFRMMGAPQRCVTRSRSIAAKIASAVIRRKQTCVPATSDSVQGKHQPSQWNIGSVHRYNGCAGKSHSGGDGVGIAHQRRAAMVVDDALRVAGRARRVVQGDGIPFVGGSRQANPGSPRATKSPYSISLKRCRSPPKLASSISITRGRCSISSRAE